MRKTPLRTEKTHFDYENEMIWRKIDADKGVERPCYLCEAYPLRVSDHWKIVKNTFPYDEIADKHHMLVPDRHIASWDDLEVEEIEDLWAFVQNLNKDIYDSIGWNFSSAQSMKDHLHLHLLRYKKL